MNDIYWGFDMGGTKIEGAVIRAGKKLEILARERVPTEQEQGYEHVLSRFALLIERLREKTGYTPTRVGIGTPGTIDSKSHLIKNSNTQCIIGKPMKEDLQNLLGLEVRMANDANCFAMAEALLGSVPEHVSNPEIVFGVILGTGVGGGIVANGKILNGLHGIAGEWGHNCLDPEGDLCYCGHRGCVETFLCGPATERYFKKISGQSMPMKDIDRLYHEGDPHAVATMDRYMHYFGRAMATIINIIDPTAIVFGGGLGHLDIIYQRGHDEVLRHLFNKELNTLFLCPKLGDSAGVVGAALL